MGGQVKLLNEYSAIGIQNKIHHEFLAARGVDRVVQSEIFATAWNTATKEQRDTVLNYLTSFDIKNWIAEILIGGLDQYSMTILRQIAIFCHIKNYSRMSKAQLLKILKGEDDGIQDRNRDYQRLVDQYARIARNSRGAQKANSD